MRPAWCSPLKDSQKENTKLGDGVKSKDHLHSVEARPQGIAITSDKELKSDPITAVTPEKPSPWLPAHGKPTPFKITSVNEKGRINAITFSQGGIFNRDTKYKLVKKIGQGKHGKVYLFERVDSSDDRTSSGPEMIVLKVAKGKANEKILTNEAQCNAETDTFSGISPDQKAIAYEFKVGTDLAKFYKNISAESNTLQLFLQISNAAIRALIQFHKKQWAHTDLVAGNIIIRNIAGHIEADIIDRSYSKRADDWNIEVDIYQLGTALSDLYSANQSKFKKTDDSGNEEKIKFKLNLLLDAMKRNLTNKITLEEVLQQLKDLEKQLNEFRGEAIQDPREDDHDKLEMKQKASDSLPDLGTQRSLPESIPPRLGTNKCGLFGDSKRATHPHKPTPAAADGPAGEEAPRKGSSTVMKDLLPGRPTPQPKIRQAGVNARNFFEGSERSTHHPLEPTLAEPIASFSRR